MKVTLISDTHTRHRHLGEDLPGGDLLIHAGDFMNSGYSPYEAEEFFNWLDKINNYDFKVFIAGNHDRWMENESETARGILTGHKTIEYLQDDWMIVGDGDPHDPNTKTAKIYGSPWQPEFFNWAFNLPRNGEEMKARWDAIPDDTDILVTHGPPHGYLDVPGGQSIRVGCEMLRSRVDELKPKIHVFGHIHGSHGYYYNGHTHFFNAAVLDERYNYTNKPFTFDWNPVTNEIIWL
jgi:Icc-related predicted phosphoesterase